MFVWSSKFRCCLLVLPVKSKRAPVLDFRALGAEVRVLHRGTQCSMALSKSCSHRRSTSSRTDLFFSGNNRHNRSKEPGGTIEPLLTPSDVCKTAVGFGWSSRPAVVSSLATAKNRKYQEMYHKQFYGWARSDHLVFPKIACTNCLIYFNTNI